MKTNILLLALIFILLPISHFLAQEIPESSSEKFNTRGIFDNPMTVSKGHEIISDYDGNFMLQYSTELEYPDDLGGNFTIIYNANVAHKMFNNDELSLGVPPQDAGSSINAPEWILGYKKVLHYRH